MRGAIHHKCQRGSWPGWGLDDYPSRYVVNWFVGELAAKKLSELMCQVVPRKVVQDAPALPASVEHHHKTRLLWRASKSSHPHAKGAVPTPSYTDLLADMVDLRLPNQRAINEEAGWRGRGRMRLDDPRDPVVVVGIGVYLSPRRYALVIHLPCEPARHDRWSRSAFASGCPPAGLRIAIIGQKHMRSKRAPDVALARDTTGWPADQR